MAKLYHGSTLLINDDDNVKTSGDQTISGAKTFSNTVTINQPNVISYFTHLKNTSIATNGTTPSTQTLEILEFNANNGERLGHIRCIQNTDGSYTMDILVNSKVSGTSKISSIAVGVDATGNPFTQAATPATSDNSTQIATTAYVKSNLSSYQPTSTAVTHTASTAVGSSSQPVYINSSGVATAISYKFWSGTQSEYDAITTKDANTLYIILES